MDTVVGTDDNERQTFYNKFTVNVGDKNMTSQSRQPQLNSKYPAPSFSWWNPRLLMGLDGGVNITHLQGEFTPNIGLGIMSYGQYKTTPDFSILRGSLGYGRLTKLEK